MKRNLLFAATLAVFSSITACQSTEQACIDESKIKPDQICTAEYKPVCGCDGKTYGNACEADRAGVTSYNDGECAEGQQETNSN